MCLECDIAACIARLCFLHSDCNRTPHNASYNQRLREREKFDRSQAKAVTMVGSKKEKEEGSGKVSEVWRTMSLEDLEPIPEPEPGEQHERGWKDLFTYWFLLL